MRRPWELWEEELIRDIPRGDIPGVARELNRSVGSVVSKRYRLGVGPPKRPWSEAEDLVADRLVAEGGSVQDAARALGRSRISAYLRREARREAGAVVALARAGGRTYR